MENEENRKTSITSSFCENCRKFINRNEENNTDCDETVNRCTQWLNECNLSDSESLCTDSVRDSDSFLTEADDNTEDSKQISVLPADSSVTTADKIVVRNNVTADIAWDQIVNKKPNHYENIRIYKAQNIHIGDVTNINGPVYIDNFSPTINQNILIENSVNNPRAPLIVRRLQWLAQPPLDPTDLTYFSEPPKFVVISHTATEEAYTQTDNNYLVRLIQQFHIESRKWNDIAYNFLIGADGSIYEGRGWKRVGSHTYRFNDISLGISFIGCYMRTLPSKIAMQKAQELIKYGVEIGAIAEDYTLLGMRQCTSTESPGGRFFEELKNWERWDGSITVDNPPKVVLDKIG